MFAATQMPAFVCSLLLDFLVAIPLFVLVGYSGVSR